MLLYMNLILLKFTFFESLETYIFRGDMTLWTLVVEI